jgi:hypothetical protein
VLTVFVKVSGWILQNAKVRLRSGGIVLDALVNQVMTDGGISEPKKAWRLIMDKYGIKKKL